MLTLFFVIVLTTKLQCSKLAEHSIGLFVEAMHITGELVNGILKTLPKLILFAKNTI
jgi:hypothetical protein